MSQISLKAQIAEAQRELGRRRQCDPTWMRQGRLGMAEAMHPLPAMEAIMATLQRLVVEQGHLPLFGETQSPWA